MRISYDPKYDILYLQFKKASKVLCKDIEEDMTLDLDGRGKIVGIEILSASKHVDLGLLLPVDIKKERLALVSHE